MCEILRSVCLCVCLFVCLSVCMSQKPHVQISPILFPYIIICGFGSVFLWWQYDMLCTSVLWMTSCLHIIERMGRNWIREKAYVSSSSRDGGTEGEVYWLRLHLNTCTSIITVKSASSTTANSCLPITLALSSLCLRFCFLPTILAFNSYIYLLTYINIERAC